MKLYDRDYFTITEYEIREWEKIKNEEKVNIPDKNIHFHQSLYFKYPLAIRHYLSLFPNNHIDVFALNDFNEKYRNILDKFISLINNKETSERDILKFIKANEAYYIICSILRKNYNFGHHDLYLFPEFELPPDYKTDYLIAGSSTGGFEFVFVELENIYNNITLKDGSFGETIRKGLSQIEDWDTWLESNFSNLKLVFEKSSNKKDSIPREFIDFDKSRIHYCIIAGRREDYKEKTYRLRRKYKSERDILILHYDNLVDYSKLVLEKHGY